MIQRDTIQTAKLVASLDQVSKGRFLFGIGCGWNAEEMEDHGTAYETRTKKMRDGIVVDIAAAAADWPAGYCDAAVAACGASASRLGAAFGTETVARGCVRRTTVFVRCLTTGLSGGGGSG